MFNVKKGTKVEISSKKDGEMEYSRRRLTENVEFGNGDIIISPETAYEQHGIERCNYYTFKFSKDGKIFWITVDDQCVVKT